MSKVRVNKNADVMDITLYGVISKYGRPSSQSIADDLRDIKGVKLIRIYVNSDGGSVAEGISIFNQLKRLISESGVKVIINVDGVAASMAAVLLQVPGAVRRMGKYTRCMYHRVGGMAMGSADDLRGMADLMESFETDLIDIIATNTGLKNEEVKKKWFDGKDHWLTPDQALKAGLIDEIIDGVVMEEPSTTNDIKDVISHYDLQIQNFNNKNQPEMERTEIIAQLGLKPNATDVEIKAAMQAATDAQNRVSDLEAENERLKNEAEAKNKAEVKNIIDAAIKAKKITESQRATYQNLFDKDFDSAKAALEAIPEPQNLGNLGDGDESPIPENRKEWSFKEWQRKDGKGLQNLKDNHFEEYKNLYKNEFDKEPGK